MTLSCKDYEAEQAGFMTADWLREAKDEIDSLFGEGFTKKNPELLGRFMQAASMKYLASSLSPNDGLSKVALSLGCLADSFHRGDLSTGH